MRYYWYNSPYTAHIRNYIEHFLYSTVFIRLSFMLSGTPSSGGHKKRPSRKQVGNFWVVFNWTETSRPFHFMSYFPTTMLCSFGYPHLGSSFHSFWLSTFVSSKEALWNEWDETLYFPRPKIGKL